jgi:hypothetical protein
MKWQFLARSMMQLEVNSKAQAEWMENYFYYLEELFYQFNYGIEVVMSSWMSKVMKGGGWKFCRYCLYAVEDRIPRVHPWMNFLNSAIAGVRSAHVEP